MFYVFLCASLALLSHGTVYISIIRSFISSWYYTCTMYVPVCCIYRVHAYLFLQPESVTGPGEEDMLGKDGQANDVIQD